MNLLKKNLFVFFAIIFVYIGYFFFHQGNTAQTVKVLGITNNIELFEQPQDGRKTILAALNNAQKEINMEMYLLTDKQIISALIDAHNRGVLVYVLLEEHPFGTPTLNKKTFQTLSASGVTVAWASPSFSLTHEKAIVIDGVEAFILNQNLTAASFTKNREYNIIDTNPQDIQKIRDIFFADEHRKAISISDSHLVISPINARNMLVSFLQSSQKEIDLETEVIDDPEVIQALEQKASSIPVTIIFPDFSKVAANKNIAMQLLQHGVKVHTLFTPYIHAKLILVDNANAYIGSVNLTTQSMDSNRELGIIFSDPTSVASLQDDFQNDWENSHTFSMQ